MDERKYAIVDKCGDLLFFMDHRPTDRELLEIIGIEIYDAREIINPPQS